jgi:predicted O-methyltransferase YrrM
MTWKSIDGWLSEAEGEKLQELARGKVVLELGSYKGRSTVCMAEVAELVVAVDWHRGGEDIGFRDTLWEFMEVLDGHGVRDKVIPVVARHEDVGPVLARGGFDLAFIDGCHDRESVDRDSFNALLCIEYRGVIAWHDCGHVKYPDVKAYLEDAEFYCPSRLVDSLAWKEFGQ